LLSAQTDIGQRLAATGLSGEALLGKPLNPELLFAAVAKTAAAGPVACIANSAAQQPGYGQRPVQPAVFSRLPGTGAGRHRRQRPAGGDHADRTGQPARRFESQDVAAADEVVEQAAKRLQTVLGPDPIAARFGDAIFTVLLGFTSQEALLATARAVQAAWKPTPTGWPQRRHSSCAPASASASPAPTVCAKPLC
jgi:hypothetical protein